MKESIDFFVTLMTTLHKSINSNHDIDESDTGQPLQSLAIFSYEVACVLSTPTYESHLFKNSTQNAPL